MTISIIIPAFNIENYIEYCIRSVIKQQADCKIEVIIIDDGSSDGTAKICDAYSGVTGVRVLHKTNGGLSSARNAGIDVATGDYVMFLDGDDYLADGAISYLLDILKNTDKPIDFIQYCYTEVEDYNNPTKNLEELRNISIITDKHEVFSRKLSLGGIGASACTKLINRKLLYNIRFKEGIIHEDEQFTSRLIDNIKDGVIYSNASLYCYVMRQGSIIKSDFTKKKLDIIPVLEEQIAILNKNGYKDLAQVVRSRLFVSLCLLYESARRSGDDESGKYIESFAKTLAKEGKLSLNSKFSVIASGLKFNLPMFQCYYIFKRTNKWVR